MGPKEPCFFSKVFLFGFKISKRHIPFSRPAHRPQWYPIIFPSPRDRKPYCGFGWRRLELRILLYMKDGGYVVDCNMQRSLVISNANSSISPLLGSSLPRLLLAKPLRMISERYVSALSPMAKEKKRSNSLQYQNLQYFAIIDWHFGITRGHHMLFDFYSNPDSRKVLWYQNCDITCTCLTSPNE